MKVGRTYLTLSFMTCESQELSPDSAKILRLTRTGVAGDLQAPNCSLNDVMYDGRFAC